MLISDHLEKAARTIRWASVIVTFAALLATFPLSFVQIIYGVDVLATAATLPGAGIVTALVLAAFAVTMFSAFRAAARAA